MSIITRMFWFDTLTLLYFWISFHAGHSANVPLLDLSDFALGPFLLLVLQILLFYLDEAVLSTPLNLLFACLFIVLHHPFPFSFCNTVLVNKESFELLVLIHWHLNPVLGRVPPSHTSLCRLVLTHYLLKDLSHHQWVMLLLFLSHLVLKLFALTLLLRHELVGITSCLTFLT